ncbi:MAG: SPFH domain-containing protein [Lachnospiraceae bacterium]|nr:SPFH domain-containing protein [Lachnospiraceae bacterium]
MGILKALAASVTSEAADQWKEFFYCESIPAELIMVRAYRQQSAQSANKGNPDIITDGSVIAVADGECAIVVSNGKVVSVFRDAGENIFHSGETYGVFSGSSVKQLGKELGRRISFGGDAPALKQRVYYMNTKEIPGNSFGGSIPFRIADPNLGLDIDCKLVVSGLFSFRICDPEKIYKQLIGNVEHVYSVSYLISQMRTEVNGVLMSSFKNVTEMPLRPYAISTIIPEIEALVKNAANEKLRELRGIELVSLGFDRFSLTGEDMQIIGELQRNAVLQNMEMAAATLVNAQAEAMQAAANNTTAGTFLGLSFLPLFTRNIQ